MCTSIFKGIFRTGVISVVLVGLGLGAALAIAGPHRTKAVIHKVQDTVVDKIDRAIDDPTALRAQLQEMSREYPQRIAAVRGDLAELEGEIEQLEREKAIAKRVVQLADQDLAMLEPELARAQTASFEAGSELRRVAIATNEGEVYSLNRATDKVRQTRATRQAYADRAVDADHDLVYLRQQAQRMTSLAVELETEHASFQSQLMQLNRQVESIQRNEKLIDLMEERQKTIDELSRFEAVSLDQITQKLGAIRKKQEATLDVLSNTRQQTDYEDAARQLLEAEESAELEDAEVVVYEVVEVR